MHSFLSFILSLCFSSLTLLLPSFSTSCSSYHFHHLAIYSYLPITYPYLPPLFPRQFLQLLSHFLYFKSNPTQSFLSCLSKISFSPTPPFSAPHFPIIIISLSLSLSPDILIFFTSTFAPIVFIISSTASSLLSSFTSTFFYNVLPFFSSNSILLLTPSPFFLSPSLLPFFLFPCLSPSIFFQFPLFSSSLMQLEEVHLDTVNSNVANGHRSFRHNILDTVYLDTLQMNIVQLDTVHLDTLHMDTVHLNT